MSYEEIRRATLDATKKRIADGATKRQILHSAAKMRADAMLCPSYDREPMGAWPAFILKTASEVSGLAEGLP